ncbi:MAG TPA: peptidoglycan editing factor PgeF [Acidobacteriaceae bacterium]|nr:peptidoglycan editing factor PgeF [Acidobacteriaceae bacterium]
MPSPRTVSADPIDELVGQGELVSNPRSALSRGRRREPQPEHKGIEPQAQRRVAKSRVEVVRAAGWNAWPWLVHGFSTRTGGVTTVYRPDQHAGELNLGFTQTDTRESVVENRRRFLKALGAPASMKMVTLRQIHSSSVLTVGEHELSESCQGDGLMTNQPGVLLAIQTADCIPVLVADVKKKAVAAFHAGWRGTVKRIVESGIGKMRVAFRSRPEDLVAAIGPGIAACCYAVGEEVRSEFGSQFSYAAELFHEVSDTDPIREKYPMLFLTARAPGHSELGPSLHLDLMEANRRQLLDAGLRAEAITVIGDCTRCQNNRYFSYRAEQGFTGRMLSVVGIRR